MRSPCTPSCSRHMISVRGDAGVPIITLGIGSLARFRARPLSVLSHMIARSNLSTSMRPFGFRPSYGPGPSATPCAASAAIGYNAPQMPELALSGTRLSRLAAGGPSPPAIRNVAFTLFLGIFAYVAAARQGEPWLSIRLASYVTIIATGTVNGLALLGSVAGRGRPLPGAQATPWLRLCIACLFVAIYADRLSSPLSVTTALMVVLGIGQCASRLTAPSLATALALGTDAFETVQAIADGDTYNVLCGASDIAFICLIALALRQLHCGKTRIHRLGIYPWAPSDLCIIPRAAYMLTNRILMFNSPSRAYVAETRFYIGILIPLTTAVGVTAALRYLTGRTSSAPHPNGPH